MAEHADKHRWLGKIVDDMSRDEAIQALKKTIEMLVRNYRQTSEDWHDRRSDAETKGISHG